MDNNIFRTTNDATNSVVEKIKQGVQKYLIFFVLIFNVVVSVVSKIYRLGLQNPFTEGFIVDFMITTSTSMLCYLSFIPLGRQDELIRSETFTTVIDTWNDLSDKVRNAFLYPFEAFCHDQVGVEREEKKKLIISNKTIITYEDYKSKYENKSFWQLLKLQKEGKISKKERKAIAQANRVSVKPIQPLLILQEAQETHFNDAGRKNNNYARKQAVKKPFVIFAFSLAINAITTSMVTIDSTLIIDMLLSLFSIVVASYGGYSTGVNDFIYKENKIKAKIVFLKLFFEKEKIE